MNKLVNKKSKIHLPNIELIVKRGNFNKKNYSNTMKVNLIIQLIKLNFQMRIKKRTIYFYNMKI